MDCQFHRVVPSLFFTAIIGLLLIFGSGCAHEARKPSSPMDSARHHVFTGNRLLEQKRVDEAMREFDLALGLDPKYSPAHLGKGLALALKGDFEEARKSIKLAEKHAQSRTQKAMVRVGYMKLYMIEKYEGWLDKVRDHYEEALDEYEDMPDAHFYMGMAYKKAHLFQRAAKEFEKVLDINQAYVGQADQELKLVSKIQRAMPGSEVGKELALHDMITRADMAAILVHELRVDRIYEREGQGKKKSGFIPRDIADNPLRADIETIIDLGLRGLQVFRDGKFSPDAPVTRASYAMIVEDIISTINHDPSLTTKFVGSPSPFPDVAPEAPYFNAVMTCTTRGIMEPVDIRTGRFEPGGYVSGADALLIIRRLKQELRIF